MNIYLNFCNYILLMYNHILNQILLEELKAAKYHQPRHEAKAITSNQENINTQPSQPSTDDTHEAQPSTRNQGNIDSQPSTSKQHPQPTLKPSVTKPANKKKKNKTNKVN